MVSFFDKLKKGMGVEMEPEGEEVQQGSKPSQKRKKPKKLEIKTEPTEAKDEAKEETKPKADKGFELARQSFAENLGGQEGQLAVDVYETDGELVIQSAIAGVRPEDLDVSIENDRVLIKGERTEKEKIEGKNYFYQECYWGQFSREIMLPAETDPSRAEASMKEGVLTIRLPKIEREKKRKVEVKS